VHSDHRRARQRQDRLLAVRPAPPLTALVASLLLLAASALPAEAKFRCGQTSACPDAGAVAEARAAAATACPCSEAASAKTYKKCWKPVVASFAKTRGKAAFPKACRKDVTRALANTTCGRPDVVLCRKVTKKGDVCKVTKAAKCADPYAAGSAFGSCADTCDEIVAEPFPSTRQLSDADLSGLAPDTGDGVLRFSPAPAALDDVGVGAILVGGATANTPAGLLRAVLAVEREGDTLTLRTAQAPIQLAFKKLHTRFVRSVALPGTTASAAMVAPRGGARTRKPFDFLLFDGDGDPETKNDQIALEGEIGASYDFSFGLDFDWGIIDGLPDVVTRCLESLVDILTGGEPRCSIDDLIPEARVAFVVHPQIEADLGVEGAAILEFEKELDLASATLAPIIIGPLVFVPAVDLTAELRGGASGEFSTGVRGSALFETSVSVSSRQTSAPQFREPVLRDTDFGPKETQVALHAGAKVGVGGRLNLLLFGVTGPYAEAQPYVAIDASVFDAPCWTLDAGIECSLGVRVTSPALPFVGKIILADWQAPDVTPLELELASGECEAPPEQSTLPPGSGPDATRLATPSYTPWSRTHASPVEGANAGSPGNGVVFSDLQRTIDGHYVRSGWGVRTLTKIADDGALVWARELRIDGGPFEPRRVRSGRDATMMVASRTVLDPIVLASVAQDGSAVGARAYDVDFEDCQTEIAALAPDGDGGFWVTGSCIGADHGFLLHARGAAARLWLLGDLPNLRLTVAEPIGSDVFLAGRALENGDPMVALRVTADGAIVWSKRYDGCAQAPDAIPSAAIVGALGDVTLAGSGGAQHNGTVVRILPDGSVGFATFPGFGFGAGSVFLLDSITELPTTGYVAGGSLVRFTGDQPDNVPAAALVGLDAAGRLLWARRYGMGGPGTYTAAGHTAVRLADDGGVVTTALAADPADPLGGFLWTFKPFAKDGTIAFAPGAASSTPLAVTDLPCTLVASDRPLTATARPIQSRTVTLASMPVTLATAVQTP